MPQESAFLLYRRPERVRRELALPPQLESWDKKEHPTQKRLARWLAHVRLGLDLPPTEALVLALDVGLPSSTPLGAGGRDLDNFLLPVVRELGPSRFVAVWGAKVHGISAVDVDSARRLPRDALAGWSFASAATSASSATTAWKAEVERQVAAQVEPTVGSGPLEVHLGLRIGAGRNWTTLWKPAIDALGPILGSDDRRRFHPRDDRIVVLGLHRTEDASLGWSVELGVWWRGATSTPRPAEHWRASVRVARPEHDAVTVFRDDDAGYLAWVALHPRGYVLNTTRSPTPSYLVLHRTACHSVSGHPSTGRRWTAQYAKVCAESDTAITLWAQSIGGHPSRCALCTP